MRYATITMLDGTVYTQATIVGAGNGSDHGVDLAVDAAEAQTWINTDNIKSIVWEVEAP